MATTENSALYYEFEHFLKGMASLTDSGDHFTFNSVSDCWSDEAGFSPVVRPDGVLAGVQVSPSLSSNNQVDISSGSLNLAGAIVTKSSATGLTCTRGDVSNPFIINSITLTSAGAFSVVPGTPGTAFSESRGVAGGAPFIPVGSIELSQVRLSSSTAGIVLASEIYASPNVHRELANYPVISSIDFVRERESVLFPAGVTFSCAMMCNHTGGVVKGVYAQYYEPEFVEIGRAADFQPSSNSFSTTSNACYGGVVGEVSRSLKAGKFRAYLDDGVSDAILTKEGKKIWFKFLPDRYFPDKYVLTHGFMGVSAKYPAKGSISADFTINSVNPGVRITG